MDSHLRPTPEKTLRAQPVEVQSEHPLGLRGSGARAVRLDRSSPRLPVRGLLGFLNGAGPSSHRDERLKYDRRFARRSTK
jgi:hypothetical protein